MACHFTVVHSFQSAVAYYKECLYYCLKSFAKHSPLISLVFCEIWHSHTNTDNNVCSVNMVCQHTRVFKQERYAAVFFSN